MNRPIAKERLATLAQIVNRSANESDGLLHFYLLLSERLKASNLPDCYKDYAGTRQFAGTMWRRFLDLGACLSADSLVEIERQLHDTMLS